MPLRSIACFLALALCWAQLALAQEEPAVDEQPVRVGYIEFPPYSYTDPKGEARGDLIDLFKLLVQRAGYRSVFIEYPSFRLFKAMESGQLEMCPSLVRHPVMRPYTLRSRYLIVSLKLNLYYKDKPPPMPLEKLRNRRLLTIQGLVYPGSPLEPLAADPTNGIVRVTAPTHQAAAQMMHLQRADYLLDYKDPAETGFQESGLPVLPSVPVLQQDFTIAYSRRSPRAEQLRDDLDRMLDELRARGELPKRFADIAPYKVDAGSSPK